MPWIAVGVLVGVGVLAHTAPFSFILDWLHPSRSVWRMPPRDPPTVFLTFDDGPNPAATPALLDLLAREGVRATFFVIDKHVTDTTAPIVRRMAAEGHALALHSHTRRLTVMSPSALAETLSRASARLETNHRPAAVRGVPASRRMAQLDDAPGRRPTRPPAGGMGLALCGISTGIERRIPSAWLRGWPVGHRMDRSWCCTTDTTRTPPRTAVIPWKRSRS